MEYPLTKTQQKAFDKIEGSMKNFLLQGPPGTGKSVLIKALMELGNKTYTLAAPTGLAALNIGGRTLHSIFRLPTSWGVIEHDFNNFTADDRTLSMLKYSIKHLIIDEVSMVRADMFDYLDRLCRHAKGYHAEPFGGIQIIIVGDFFQLPPVVIGAEKHQLRKAGFESPFVFSSNVFQSNFEIIELKEILRQKGDSKFIKLLGDARVGAIDHTQLKALNQLVLKKFDDIRIRLCARNKEAEVINGQFLAEISAPSSTFYATKFGDWPAYPCEEELELKVGAQVMVKQNAADRPLKAPSGYDSILVNGTMGVVVEIFDGSEGVEEFVKIEVEGGEQFKIYKKRWERKTKQRVGEKWEEVVVASFEQIPLALAWAISIHKSQGQSFDKAHIHASGIFEAGQLYVALSRVRTFKGVSFDTPIKASQFWANESVVEFFENQTA